MTHGQVVGSLNLSLPHWMLELITDQLKESRTSDQLQLVQ